MLITSQEFYDSSVSVFYGAGRHSGIRAAFLRCTD
jgi:hypothetical protein